MIAPTGAEVDGRMADGHPYGVRRWKRAIGDRPYGCGDGSGRRAADCRPYGGGGIIGGAEGKLVGRRGYDPALQGVGVGE